MINKHTRKNSNPYLMLNILTSINSDIEHAELPIKMNKAEKAEFIKNVYIETMLDVIEMIKSAPYGAIPVIRNIKEINNE